MVCSHIFTAEIDFVHPLRTRYQQPDEEFLSCHVDIWRHFTAYVSNDGQYYNLIRIHFVLYYATNVAQGMLIRINCRMHTQHVSRPAWHKLKCFSVSEFSFTQELCTF